MDQPAKHARPRYRIFIPLIYLAALVLMLEDWFWDLGARLMRRLAAWPPLHALEARIRTLSPAAALGAFILPGLLLFPVKVLALLAIAHGHALAGIAVIALAKVGGAALVARLYLLTRPALLSVAWFARLHDGFLRIKDRWVGYLRASRAYRDTRAAVAALRAAGTALFAGRGRRTRFVRRCIALWRARRR